MNKLFILFFIAVQLKAQEQTYSTRLGWKSTDKVIILHVDDVGGRLSALRYVDRRVRHAFAAAVDGNNVLCWIVVFLSAGLLLEKPA